MQQIQDSEPQFQMTCVRKHFLNSKRYYLHLFENQMVLSDNKQMINPKYIIPFKFDQRIMWRNSENNELNSFGLFYNSKIKWFEGDNQQLNLLKYQLSPKIFFGNISLFYDSLQVIGSGASSKVCQVKRKSDLLTYAAKCISKQYLTSKKSSDRMERLQQEIKILQSIEHPQFVKLLEIYQGENSYYLVTDLLEGDTLYNYVKCYPGDQIPNHITRTAILKILQALEYLESIGIIHRDIKLENILLAKHNDISTIKIIDFGLAIYANKKQKLSVCGTPGYMAPEVLRYDNSNQKEEYFSTKCDVFSAGVIFYKLLTKRTLFRAENTCDIMEANRKCQIHYHEFDFKLQKEAVTLLKDMLNPDPKLRPTARECLQYSYFVCKLQEINLLSEFQDRATQISAQTGRYGRSQQQDSDSIGNEGAIQIVKKCNPTSYVKRVQARKRTRSPRKYADANFYYPSFCQNSLYESDNSNSQSFSKSVSKEKSRLEVIQVDEVIEDNKDI